MTGALLEMSREAIDWALRDAPDVPAQWVAALLSLAHHADKLGRGAYVSAGTLAKYTRKSERQIRYDLEGLNDAKLIRPGDQSLVKKYPPNRRPVVYDLAMERVRPDAEVQSTAPQDSEPGVQSTSGVQSTAPRQSTAPQTEADLQEAEGVQSTAPLGADFLGCNAAQPGVQPTADKQNMNLKPSVVDVDEGGSGGDGSTPDGKPRPPRRDLNEGRDDAMRICIHLADRIELNTGERPDFGTKWITAARLMIDNDHRAEEQVHKAIDWCQDNEFWRRNIMSIPKLREKYLTLRMQAEDERKAQANGRPAGAPGPDRARGWMAAGRAFQEQSDQSGKGIPA